MQRLLEDLGGVVQAVIINDMMILIFVGILMKVTV